MTGPFLLGLLMLLVGAFMPAPVGPVMAGIGFLTAVVAVFRWRRARRGVQ